jgi:hypothetical protein
MHRDLNRLQTQEELLGFSIGIILPRRLQEGAISTGHIYSLQNLHCLRSNLLCIINLFITYFRFAFSFFTALWAQANRVDMNTDRRGQGSVD